MVELVGITKHIKGLANHVGAEITAANVLSVSRPMLVAAANKAGLDSPWYPRLMVAAQVTDIFDGRVARKYGASPYGGLVDIIADHATEGLMYQHLRDEKITPSWVPTVTTTRHFITDSLRVAHTVFDSSVMHETNGVLQLNGSETAKKIVGSRVMRGGFGVLKAAVPFVAPSHPRLARDLSVLAAGVSVVRGIPVVFNRENIRLLQRVKEQISQKH